MAFFKFLVFWPEQNLTDFCKAKNGNGTNFKKLDTLELEAFS